MLTLTCFDCVSRHESEVDVETYMAPCSRCAMVGTVRILDEPLPSTWSQVSTWGMLLFAATFTGGTLLWIYSLACAVLSPVRDR